MKKSIIVIGGGAAGMMAACAAAARGHRVTLLEKNDRLGKKLLITGKGRCNLTNMADVPALIENVPGNPSFLYSAFYAFDSDATIAFFDSLGLRTKVERGNRVFPVSDQSADVVNAFYRRMSACHVDIRLRTTAKAIETNADRVCAVVDTNNCRHTADAVIVATGGLSYPATGATGDGYAFARAAGHTIAKLRPALVPLLTVESFVPDLQGLSLKNVGLTVQLGGKTVFKDFGEMLFTHFGVSGPIILRASRHLSGRHGDRPTLLIDLKPALSEKELDARLLRDFEKYCNKDLINALDDLLPQKLIPVVVALSGADPHQKVRDLTREGRKRLLAHMKGLAVTVRGDRGYKEAVITTGGVSVDEVDPTTMASKRLAGLYFAGEVLDVDGFTGGFNLQIAFSTGHAAGSAV